MADKPRHRLQKDNVLTALGYALPVLGGFLGMVYVNINHMAFINPVWAVAGGVILGWVAARVLRKTLG